MAFKSFNRKLSIEQTSAFDKTELFSKLFNARDVIHIAHLKTTSYAAHKTLNSVYEDLLDFADELTEMYQGEIGARIDFSIPASSYQEPIQFLKDLNIYLQNIKNMYCDSIINKIEELQGKINQNLYKLTILK